MEKTNEKEQELISIIQAIESNQIYQEGAKVREALEFFEKMNKVLVKAYTELEQIKAQQNKK
jgi:hypothetical protein